MTKRVKLMGWVMLGLFLSFVLGPPFYGAFQIILNGWKTILGIN